MSELNQDSSPSQCISPVANISEVENEGINTPIRRVEQLEAPYVGMLFESIEEARKYYEEYGRQEGFWVRTQCSVKTRSHSDEVTSCRFVCAHQGKYVWKKRINEGWKKDHQKETCDNENSNENGDDNVKKTGGLNTKKPAEKNCSTAKCGCKATMRIVHQKWSNKWRVSVFSDFHNHKVVTPARRMKMKSNKHMPKAAKSMTEIFHKENLPIAKVHSILGGAQIGFNKRDCYNHLKSVRHRQLDGGDAQSVLTYFRKKQAENPQFFYAIQCDEDGRATNFFWVDPRSRTAYEYFGDVITFDTTYRTNKYDMPFAPFTGVNHHWQSIQFGCALLQDETEATFVWLFETWLEAMGGRPPISIITDQDMAMKGAIAKIFPNTRHRLCLWHIKKKFVEKLSHVYYKKSKFKKEMKKCIQFTYKTEDFEEKWKALKKESVIMNGTHIWHLLKVFSRLDIETIPAHFILPRWRQEANKFRIMDSELVKSASKEESEALRLGHMCHQATKLACIAAHSKEGYTLFMEALNDISKNLSKLPDQPVISREMSAPINQQDHPIMETCASPNRDDMCTNTLSSQSLLLDPNISKTKGRKKETKSSGRIKSGVELAMETGKRKCTLCSKSGHNKKTCSLNSQRKNQ